MVNFEHINERKLETAFDALLTRVETTLQQTDGRFPYVADSDTGEWETTEDGSWAGGHWIGLLWLAYQHAKDAAPERFADAARACTEILCTQDFDNIFLGMGLHYAGFRGYDATGDRSLFGLGLTGADKMVTLYDEAARQIPIGEFGDIGEEGLPGTQYAAVDIVYTSLPVLWRAYRETGDPTFRDVAVSHTDRHLDWHVRDNGSVQQLAVFDPETGEIERQFSNLAYANESCWARGQGWNIAGLARAYRETGAKRYLNTLELCIDYWVEQTPDDLIPYWDFELPDSQGEPRDTSAAALAAYGLTRLELDDERIVSLRGVGERILDSIISSYLVTDQDDDRRGMVLHGCYSRPGNYAVDNELIWTDYYVAYALCQLIND